jgi:hypothetical protein
MLETRSRERFQIPRRLTRVAFQTSACRSRSLLKFAFESREFFGNGSAFFFKCPAQTFGFFGFAFYAAQVFSCLT